MDSDTSGTTGRPFWKDHYVVQTDADEIERHLTRTSFPSGATRFELLAFLQGQSAPNILVSQGSGGHSYVFAELGYLLHMQGYNVFIMPKHGDGFTINSLVQRHWDAAQHICSTYNDRLGVFGEGLGSFVSFYLALAHGPLTSLVCQNGPAILTEAAFQEAILQGSGAADRRKRLLPLLRLAARPLPWIRLPISLYLDWQELIDPKQGNREVETRLVVGGYLKDPEFDRWYRLSSILSQLSTPPPNPLSELTIPTMFLVPVRGWSDPSYEQGLYSRLPPSIKKRLLEVDGSVYWMLSHPTEAAMAIGRWFDETL
jgi:pimeloyl-ACP methyl ester carboxylesterase